MSSTVPRTFCRLPRIPLIDAPSWEFRSRTHTNSSINIFSFKSMLFLTRLFLTRKTSFAIQEAYRTSVLLFEMMMGYLSIRTYDEKFNLY